METSFCPITTFYAERWSGLGQQLVVVTHESIMRNVTYEMDQLDRSLFRIMLSTWAYSLHFEALIPEKQPVGGSLSTSTYT